jgi:hypothetical protein
MIQDYGSSASEATTSLGDVLKKHLDGDEG